MYIFKNAIEAQKAGRLDEATSGYRQILEHEPDHADALHLLGVIEMERGDLLAAENLIRKAISINENAIFMTNLSNVLMDQQRVTDAEALLRRALVLSPLYATAHYNLGLLLKDTGAASDAKTSMGRAVELQPDFIEALISLGVLLMDTGELAESETVLKRALSLDDTRAVIPHHLGRLMFLDERMEEAKSFFRQTIRLDSGVPDAYAELAAVLLKLKRPEEAEAACREALAVDPVCAAAHANLGAALIALKQPELAEASLRTAIRLNPDHALSHYNLGVQLLMERIDEAQVLLMRAHELAPSHIGTCHALGYTYSVQNRYEEAEALFRHVLKHWPNHVGARWDLSLALLSEGRFEEGWRLYEARTVEVDGEAISMPPKLDFPAWQGEPLQGKTLVVVHEQGYGDFLQICRYLPMLKGLGLTRLSVICRPALRPLIESIEGVDACIERDFVRDVPDHDFWCFMMSLPLRFGTTVDSIPATTPYLRVPDEQWDSWKRRLPMEGFKVGLVWAGEARLGTPAENAADRRRSLHVQAFLPLLEVPNVTFVSLQMGETTRPQLDSIPHDIRPLDPMGEVADFADTAAIIECLDLVIAVDTSTAHLAGALNKPVWILSRFDACWRWLRDRDDSPWYPSARLFRQQKAGDWDGVIERVAQALRTRVHLTQ
jgi:tetratricopeptide (TPR) repeat protein